MLDSSQSRMSELFVEGTDYTPMGIVSRKPNGQDPLPLHSVPSSSKIMATLTTICSLCNDVSIHYDTHYHH